LTPKAMTLNDLEHWNRGFHGFYVCLQWAFIHALLSRVPFALAGLSCLPLNIRRLDGRLSGQIGTKPSVKRSRHTLNASLH